MSHARKENQSPAECIPLMTVKTGEGKATTKEGPVKYAINQREGNDMIT